MTDRWKDAIAAALPVEIPGATFDTESVLRAGRRIRRHRRWLAGAATAGMTVMIVLAVVTMNAVLRPGDADVPPTAEIPTTETTTPEGAPWSTGLDAQLDASGNLPGWPDDYSWYAEGTELDDQVAAVLATELPDKQVTGFDARRQDATIPKFPLLPENATDSGEGFSPDERRYYYFDVTFADGDELQISLYLPGGWLPGIAPDDQSAPGRSWYLTSCEVQGSTGECREWTEGSAAHVTIEAQTGSAALEFRTDGVGVHLSYLPAYDEPVSLNLAELVDLGAVMPSPPFDPQDVPRP